METTCNTKELAQHNRNKPQYNGNKSVSADKCNFFLLSVSAR